MIRKVNTYNTIEGFHQYPDAPAFCDYLAARHRHIFVVRCSFVVTHNNREIEINTKQGEIKTFLCENFGEPCEFGNMSCEDIADDLMHAFADMNECCVLEDGYGGATLTR